MLVHLAPRPTLAALLLAAGAPLAAQAPAPVPLRPGERVMVRVTAPPTGPVGLRCEARVALVAADTLVLARAGTCPAGAYRGNVVVWRGDRGSRAAHAALGVVAGAVLGGATGWLAAGNGCTVSPCDDGGLAVAILTLLGAGAGGLAGGVVGALLPAGARWAPAGAGQPLRVAGLAVRPGVRVAVGRPAR